MSAAMPSFRVRVACGLVASACLGCQGEKQAVTILRIDEVPPALMEIAREKLPGITFDAAWQKPDGTYEIRGRARNGKIRDVDIRPDGTVAEIE